MTFEEFQRQSQLIEREMMATDAQVMAEDIKEMSAAYNPETGLIEEEYEDIEEAQVLEEKTTPEPMQTKSTGDTVINVNLGGKSEPKPVKEDPANTKTAIWIGALVIVLIVLSLIAMKLLKKKGG